MSHAGVSSRKEAEELDVRNEGKAGFGAGSRGGSRCLFLVAHGVHSRQHQLPGPGG